MNLNSKLYFIILSFIAFNLFAQDCKVKLYIKTDLPASNIYIDTNLIGKGNAEIELTKGKYYLVIQEEANRWNAKSITDSIVINECRDTTLSFTVKSEAYLNTDPQDAYVYRDSELVGYTPLLIQTDIGELILKKPGYESKAVNALDITLNKNIKLNFIGNSKSENFFERNTFKILVGGIVALGGVSAFYKLKADNNFDQYQTTGDQYYLNQTHKFDLISGITFGALQVGFGFLIYYFLSD